MKVRLRSISYTCWLSSCSQFPAQLMSRRHLPELRSLSALARTHCKIHANPFELPRRTSANCYAACMGTIFSVCLKLTCAIMASLWTGRRCV